MTKVIDFRTRVLLKDTDKEEKDEMEKILSKTGPITNQDLMKVEDFIMENQRKIYNLSPLETKQISIYENNIDRCIKRLENSLGMV